MSKIDNDKEKSLHLPVLTLYILIEHTHPLYEINIVH
jgi:hypothetical protein